MALWGAHQAHARSQNRERKRWLKCRVVVLRVVKVDRFESLKVKCKPTISHRRGMPRTTAAFAVDLEEVLGDLIIRRRSQQVLLIVLNLKSVKHVLLIDMMLNACLIA